MANFISPEEQWPVFVISLPQAKARRKTCQNALDRIGAKFAFFDAVDGAALSDAEIASVYDEAANARLFKRPLTRREIGCYLSHLVLWRRIAESGAPGGVILEDDFELDRSFVSVLHKLSRIAPSACLIKLSTLKNAVGDTIADLAVGRRLFFPDRISSLLTGYMLDRRAADVLAKAATPFYRPVDLDIKFWWKSGVPVLAVDPPVVGLGRHSEDSFIESSRESARLKGPSGQFRRFSLNIRYQAEYRMELRRSRRLREIVLRRLAAMKS